jgi:hypothetical protein
MSRPITIPEEIVYEEIYSLNEFPKEKSVKIIVGLANALGVFSENQKYKTYQIIDEMYTELNSASPSWNPTKPAGTYYNEDLWHFIDLIRQTE